MSDLLKQAIADAKAVRATALANAKAALEEAFTPKIQSMLAEKLRNELGEEQPAPSFGDEEVPTDTLAPEAPVGDVGTGVPPEAPVGGDVGMGAGLPVAPAPVAGAPVAPVAAPVPHGEEEGTEADLEEELLGQGNPDPVAMTTNLTETEKASPDYKKTTAGHKTEDPGKKMVVKATTLSTKGEPKGGDGNREASPDYKKMPTGNQVKNIKASGTEDPQGPSDELSSGPKKDDKTGTQALEENQEVDESSLDEILKELEASVNDTCVEPAAPVAAAPAPAAAPMEEEINLESLLEEKEEKEDEKDEEKDEEKSEKDEDDDEKSDKPAWLKENISLKKELEEYRTTVVYLRDRINEVNLLNAKLLYTNKLFKQANMTNEQKLKIIESFDLTKSVREAKLVYATLAESINSGARKTDTKKPVSSGTVKQITEGLASKPIASTKPTKTVITEGTEMATRFMKLAGIRKK
jgi:hypothetical protein